MGHFHGNSGKGKIEQNTEPLRLGERNESGDQIGSFAICHQEGCTMDVERLKSG